MSETWDESHSAARRLLEVMRDVGGIEKMRSDGVTYAFRSIEQVADKVHAALIDHGLIVVPTSARQNIGTDRNIGSGDKPRFQRVASCEMTYAFVNVDRPEDRIEVGMVGESADMSAKALQQSLTFAFKYLLIQSLCIGDPSDDADRQPSGDNGDEPVILQNWNASDEDIESLRIALSFVPEDQRSRMGAWWKRLEVGSIEKRRINGRHVPAAIAVAEMLANLAENDAQSVPAVTEPQRARAGAQRSSERSGEELDPSEPPL